MQTMETHMTIHPCPARQPPRYRPFMRLVLGLTACLALHAGMTAIAAPTAAPAPGSPWTSPSTGMEFVWIGELDLWVGKYEVTNGEYRQFRPAHDSGRFHAHSLNGDRQPVVEVGFDDAAAYAAWLNGQDARHLGEMRYRLPSEAEWLAYARCGDERGYPWGDEMPPAYGNYHGEEGAESWDKIAGFDDGHPVTGPVEESGQNDWGLYGVGGNVWEVTAKADDQGGFEAWRGASWADGVAYTLRGTTRDDGSGSPSNVNGFRLVLAPEGRPALSKAAPPARQATDHGEDQQNFNDEDMLPYTIQEGDTWLGIARLFVVRRDDLLRVNQDDGYEEPAEGRVIWIPPASW